MPRKISDIVPPKKKELFDAPFRRVKISYVSARPKKGLMIGAWCVFGVLTIIITLYIFRIHAFTEDARTSRAAIKDQLSTAKDKISNLDFSGANDSLTQIRTNLDSLGAEAQKTGIFSLIDLWRIVKPTFTNIRGTFEDVTSLAKVAIELTQELERLKTNGFHWFADKEGESLIQSLTTVKRLIGNLTALTAKIKNEGGATDELDALGGNWYVPVSVALYKSEAFLDQIIAWISTPRETHFLVLFQNPSEIRPGGGFIGSYADLTLKRGSLLNIAVSDIYDPDGQLDQKVIPPKQLQIFTPVWEARDANWFFDFPTSARKTIQFLERSRIYSERGTHFDGALAINVEVLKTLVAVTGPITVPDYGITLTSENILPVIQREVEAGRDKTQGAPKRILSFLTPILFQKAGEFTDAQKQELLNRLSTHLSNKDILAYFNDPAIQGFLENLGLAGKVIDLPKDFTGEYLAVVNANVDGKKSDAVMRQSITLSSAIDLEGKIQNTLTVKRSHTGKATDDAWYRAPNKDYLKIFAPLWSTLTHGEGLTLKTIPEPLAYAAQGFTKDPDLAAIEDTLKLHDEDQVAEYRESGKTVFAGWLTTKAGETKRATVTYTNPTRLMLGKNPIPYQFIYERQSGVPTDLSFSIEAPAGYRWQETKTPTFMYSSKDLPGRVAIDLTLEPEPEFPTP